MKKISIKTIVFVLSSLFLLQCIISFSLENILSSFLILISTLVTFWYLFSKSYVFSKYPLSSLPILGLNISTQSGAFFYQTITWVPLEFNLQNPVYTFLYIGIMQLSLVLAHIFYTKTIVFISLRNSISTSFIKKIGLFKIPDYNMLWFSGFIGVLSIWFSGTSDIEYGDVAGKFFVAFLPFSYGPYLIPFFDRILNVVKVDNKKYFKSLGIYTLIIIVVALVRNSRGVFALAFMTVFLVFFLYWVTGNIQLTKKQLHKFYLIIIPSLLAFFFLSDLADAMVISRIYRDDVVGWDFITLTFNNLFDRDLLSTYRQSIIFNLLNEYNETYISNPIIARLVTIKFDDNMIFYYRFLDSQASYELLKITIMKFFSLLPTPIINFLGMNINKLEFEFSIGDYIWYLFSGVGLGGYRTGSIVAHGLILFDLYFYFFVFLISPFIFSILDSFSYKERNKIYFSPIILFISFNVFSFFNGDGLNNISNFFFRSLPQLILLYFLLSIPFKNRRITNN